jgi:hypothetical protein
LFFPNPGNLVVACNVVNGASTTVFAVFDGGNARLSGTPTQTTSATTLAPGGTLGLSATSTRTVFIDAAADTATASSTAN